MFWVTERLGGANYGRLGGVSYVPLGCLNSSIGRCVDFVLSGEFFKARPGWREFRGFLVDSEVSYQTQAPESARNPRQNPHHNPRQNLRQNPRQNPCASFGGSGGQPVEWQPGARRSR